MAIRGLASLMVQKIPSMNFEYNVLLFSQMPKSELVLYNNSLQPGVEGIGVLQ